MLLLHKAVRSIPKCVFIIQLVRQCYAIRDVESKEIGKEKREREKKKRSIIIFVLVIIMEHDFSFCTYALFYVLLCTNILARYKYS